MIFSTMVLMRRSYGRYLKSLKRWRNYDIFGPTHKNIAKHKGKVGNTLIRTGNVYTIRIPKHEKHRYWKKQWDGKEVEVTGYLKLYYQGSLIVCVERDNKFLTLPANWLTIKPKNSTCTCDTSTIWTTGCQCGGI